MNRLSLKLTRMPAHVTVLRLNKEGKITRISFWNPEKEDVETHFK